MIHLRSLALVGLLAMPLAASAQDHGHALLAEANGVRIEDAYAISAAPAASTGAAYMRITNTNAVADRLVAVEGDVARRIELHAHLLEDGVARMVALDAGIDLPPGETVSLERGGLHVMLMGLAGPLDEGAEIDLTLVFETAGRIAVAVPVDRSRTPDEDAEQQH